MKSSCVEWVLNSFLMRSEYIRPLFEPLVFGQVRYLDLHCTLNLWYTNFICPPKIFYSWDLNNEHLNNWILYSDHLVFRCLVPIIYLARKLLTNWITNIWITETSENRTFRNPVFRASDIQIPSSYYLPGKKIFDKLSTIQITILITGQNSQVFRSPSAHQTTFDHLNTRLV